MGALRAEQVWLARESGISQEYIGEIKGGFICLGMSELRDYQPNTGAW